MLDTSYERFFGTLANENRLSIVQYLLQCEHSSVNDIAENTSLEQSLVSRHMHRLLSCHFVSVTQQGKERIYALNQDTIAPLLKLIDSHIENYCSCESCVSCDDKCKCNQ
ncbi:TPA: transcriptional regulator [Candidatus Saccharibacteria bacterium]|nr:transcriptional regulator [Candidatus Saccharibacteria bacterium]HIO87604.1 transcriptional regulator [Candidatus Saccharibacteria bacterium]